VRQIRNEAERVVGMAERGERITLAMLSLELRNGNALADDERTLKEILRHVAAAEIMSRLRKYSYNRTDTAKSLGLSRERLWFKMRDLGIDVPE